MFVLVKQPAQIHEGLVGNVIVVNAHPFPLATQEVGCIDGTSTAAINCVKTFPVGIAAALLREQRMENVGMGCTPCCSEESMRAGV